MNDETAGRALIADDEASIRFVLREALEGLAFEVTEAVNGEEALEHLVSNRFQIAFLDIRMPGTSGLDLLTHASSAGLDTAIIIITAQNTFDNAVEAMKRGAFDYLTKPFSIAEIEALANKAKRNRSLQVELRELRRNVAGKVVPGDRLVGKSAALLEVFKTIGRVAPTDVSVLIRGESGTGKELVANAIHAASTRSDRPFLAVNTAAIPRELLESELFGHEIGAFTGASKARSGRFREADGGTLFLDEIGDMGVDLQAKLLRVLQNGEIISVGGQTAQMVDVRIVAATHRDLEALVREGKFREDLLYRLEVVPIHLPALRDRLEDIHALSEHFVSQYAEKLVGEERFISRDAMDRLTRYDWPGNVRELENSIKRALVLSNGRVLPAEDFDFLTSGTAPDDEAGTDLTTFVNQSVDEALDAGESGELYRRLLESIERPLIKAVLSRTDGNQIRSAAILGINRNTLRKKIRELGIRLPGRS